MSEDFRDAGARPTVFVSYEHQADDVIQRLCDNLPDYQLRVVNRDTTASGENWRNRIAREIDSAIAAICLLDPRFFESDFIIKSELPQLLARAGDPLRPFGLVSVFLSDCGEAFAKSPLKDYEFANDCNHGLQIRTVKEAPIFRELQAALDRAWVKARPASQRQLPAPPWNVEPSGRFVDYDDERRALAELVRDHGGLIVVSGRPRAGRRTLVRKVAHELRDAGQLPGGGSVD